MMIGAIVEYYNNVMELAGNNNRPISYNLL